LSKYQSEKKLEDFEEKIKLLKYGMTRSQVKKILGTNPYLFSTDADYFVLMSTSMYLASTDTTQKSLAIKATYFGDFLSNIEQNHTSFEPYSDVKLRYDIDETNIKYKIR
jgi:hypothetical protein